MAPALPTSNLLFILYLRNRKHVPCLYRVIQTRVEVWEDEKCCGNTSRRRVSPQLFRVLSNLETAKPRKKSLKAAKPQEISSKTENRIKLLTHKALVVFKISLSVLNFNTYKLILISEVLSGYFLVSAEHILA